MSWNNNFFREFKIQIEWLLRHFVGNGEMSGGSLSSTRQSMVADPPSGGWHMYFRLADKGRRNTRQIRGIVALTVDWNMPSSITINRLTLTCHGITIVGNENRLSQRRFLCCIYMPYMICSSCVYLQGCCVMRDGPK